MMEEYDIKMTEPGSSREKKASMSRHLSHPDRNLASIANSRALKCCQVKTESTTRNSQFTHKLQSVSQNF
jgi:hypothetical protein